MRVGVRVGVGVRVRFGVEGRVRGRPAPGSPIACPGRTGVRRRRRRRG